MGLITNINRHQNCFCEMNKIKKSATGTISSQIAQKKHFNIVPAKSKNQEDKPWKSNNGSFRNAVSIPKVDSTLQRNDLSRLVKVNKFQSSENGRPAPDNLKVSLFLAN